jgi:hypothetical protein
MQQMGGRLGCQQRLQSHLSPAGPPAAFFVNSLSAHKFIDSDLGSRVEGCRWLRCRPRAIC